MNRLPLSPIGLIALLGAGLVASALGVVASTHHAREGYARLQDLELQRWQLQEQYTRLLLGDQHLGGASSHQPDCFRITVHAGA